MILKFWTVCIYWSTPSLCACTGCHCQLQHWWSWLSMSQFTDQREYIHINCSHCTMRAVCWLILRARQWHGMWGTMVQLEVPRQHVSLWFTNPRHFSSLWPERWSCSTFHFKLYARLLKIYFMSSWARHANGCQAKITANISDCCQNTKKMQPDHLADNTWLHTVRCIPVGSHRCRAGLYVCLGRAIDLWSWDDCQCDQRACSITFMHMNHF